MCTVFYDDFSKEDLVAELSTFHKLYQSTVGDVVLSVNSIKTALLTLSAIQQLLLKTVFRSFQKPKDPKFFLGSAPPEVYYFSAEFIYGTDMCTSEHHQFFIWYTCSYLNW